MEIEEKNTKPVVGLTVLDEATWRAHIEAAQEFSGSDQEYCRANQLGFSQFRKRKRKYGMSAVRGRPRKAFVRVEAAVEPEEEKETMRLYRPRERALPDPKWMAEFVTALLRSQ